MKLTASQVAQYEDDGYVVVRGALSQTELATVREILTDTQRMVAQGYVPPHWKNDGGVWEGPPGIAVRLVRKVPAPFERSAGFRAIFSAPAILDIVEQLIGSEIYLHSSKLIYKPPGCGRRKPFHQDLAYWDDMSAAQVTLWCAIDPASVSNGCIHVVPGSHRKGLIQHVELADWQIDETQFPVNTARPVEMAAGDALFLNVLTVHASGANCSAMERLAAIVNYYSLPRSPDQLSKYGSSEPLRTRIGTRQP